MAEWVYATLDRPAVVASLGPRSKFGRLLRAKVAAQVDEMVTATGERAVQIAEEYIQHDFINDRPAWRRRNPGTRHLAGSIRYRVEHDAVGFPTRLELYSLANPDKVFALEFGSPPHTITGNPDLVFPWAGPGERNRARNAYGTGRLVVTPQVQHPGTRRYRFMGRALERAVREVLNASVQVA